MKKNKISKESENLKTARDKGVNSTELLDILSIVSIPPCLVLPNRLGMCATTKMFFYASSNVWSLTTQTGPLKERFQVRKPLYRNPVYYKFHGQNFPSNAKACRSLDVWGELLTGRLGDQMNVGRMKHRANDKLYKKMVALCRPSTCPCLVEDKEH